MSDESFSTGYFQHLLSSLTLNSRALIVELTSLAERFVDSAQEIVDLIEERIHKILPKYKLYSFYLLDSIVKNIGNPYNIIFATNIYKNFTETYLIIDDTPTRQNMINLFKTWVSGKTSVGLDLFPKDTLLKVEKFIIQATSLASSVQPDVFRITKDTILRESNYILQYAVALDEDCEKFLSFITPSMAANDLLRLCKLVRNTLIFDTNLISESTIADSRENFEAQKDTYVERLRGIRKLLDKQRLTQEEISAGLKQLSSRLQETPQELVFVELNLPLKPLDVTCLLGENMDELFETAVCEWGKAVIFEEPRTSMSPSLGTHNPTQNLASTFGLDLESIDSHTMKEVHIFNLSGGSFEDEGDGYDPELTLIEPDIKFSPHPSPINGTFLPGKSNLKRSHVGEENQTAKKVRFEI